MTDLIKDSQIIILEGADGTGKTTLAKELAKAQGRLIMHASAPQSETWAEEYVDSITGIIPTQSLVLDRWHLGEWVWPQFFSRESLYESHIDMQECHEKLIAIGAFTIVLVRPVLDIISELSRRGESEEAAVAAIEGQASYLSLVRSANLDRTILTTMPVARELLGLT